jgi:hypothetical protein
MTRLRSIALLAVLAGLAAGIAAALLIPTTRAQNAGGATSSAPPIDPGSATVVRVARARPVPGDVEIRPDGPVRIEARAADPLGGPDWAVRVFPAERVTRARSRRAGVDPVIGRPLCAQLGRIHDGRFGWLEADGTFRPLPVGAQGGAISTCGSRTPDLNGVPTLDAVSPITDPAAPAARVRSTVAWGIAGSAARTVALYVAGRAVTPDPTAHGAFVVAVGPEVSQQAIRGTATYAGGRRRTLGHRVPGRMAGPQRLAARAPDPNGGLPFAMTVSRGDGGRFCTGSGGRVVGDRVGGVDFARDLLVEGASGGYGCSGPADGAQLRRLYQQHPVLLGWSGGTGDLAAEGGDTGATGRIARRTQRGRTTFTGTAAPGVVAVTLATPRDVRTLIPSGPTRALIVVYDGGFPTGEVKVIARFRDGHAQTDTIPAIGAP